MHSELSQADGLTHQELEPIVMRVLQRFRALLPGEVALALALSHQDPQIRAHSARLELALLSACIVAWQSMAGLATKIVVEMSEVMLDDVVLDPDAGKLQGGLPPRRYARLVISNSSRLATSPFHTLLPAPALNDERALSAQRLPLTAVRDILVQHQGMFTVSPEPGRGTAFEIYLPAALPHEIETAASSESDAGLKHIVYVDDYEAMRDLVSDTLADAGFRVSCHESAREALAALRADPLGCDVLVSDYRLQAYSGLELLRQVKLLRADLPVIIISGYVDEALKLKALEEGAALVISKAQDLSELCIALHELLGHAPRPALSAYSEWGKL